MREKGSGGWAEGRAGGERSKWSPRRQTIERVYVMQERKTRRTYSTRRPRVQRLTDDVSHGELAASFAEYLALMTSKQAVSATEQGMALQLLTDARGRTRTD